MKYSFDEVIDRTGTAAVKIDGMKEVWGRTDLLPLWVADMDFATPPFILDAIRRRCEHPILGYTEKPESYYQAIIGWVKRRYGMEVSKEQLNYVPGIVAGLGMALNILGYTEKPESYYQAIIGWVKRRYGMEVSKEQLNYVPGIVAGLGMALNCFTAPGDKVMIMPPVYHPFAWLVQRNGRRLVECPLKLENGTYRMDLDLFRRSIKGVRVLILCNPHNPGGVVWLVECPLKLENGTYRMDLDLFRRSIKGVRVLILCNPHNPGGVVWTKEELEALADVCAEDNVIVFSDEIHADLTLPPHRHVPFAMISEHARNNSVTFMAPSKAFNMPGMAASHTVIYNEGLRKRFVAYLDAGELDMGHVLAYPAVEAQGI